MNHLEGENGVGRFVNDPNKAKAELARILAESARTWKELYGEIPFPSVAAPVEKQTTRIFSKDQLILPYTELPQEASDVLKRAEKTGITSLEPYRLSGVTLTQNSQVEGWTKKPGLWYWQQIANGKIAPDSARLPDAWVLVDKTERPDYKDGKQPHKNDPFGPLLAKLREEGKIKVPKALKHIPQASRFGISPDELRNGILPEIAKLLGVDASQVRLHKEIEFNVIGNMKHPEWGKANTAEWLDDNFAGSRRLFGGRSGFGGLTSVSRHWSGLHLDTIAFRPLVVISPKAS